MAQLVNMPRPADLLMNLVNMPPSPPPPISPPRNDDDSGKHTRTTACFPRRFLTDQIALFLSDESASPGPGTRPSTLLPSERCTAHVQIHGKGKFIEVSLSLQV